MIPQETKDSIDDIATDIAVTRGTEERRQAINQEILKYAEKLEEKDKEIESLTICIVKAENGWAKSQSVTIDLQEFLRKFIIDFDKGNSDDYNLRDEAQALLSKKWPEIKFADDAQLESKDIELTVWKDTADKFKRLVEEKDKKIEGHKHRGDKGMEAAKFYQEQLAQLKEIAERMINYLKDIERCGECPSCSENAGWAITAYIEWCKQNLK